MCCAAERKLSGSLDVYPRRPVRLGRGGMDVRDVRYRGDKGGGGKRLHAYVTAAIRPTSTSTTPEMKEEKE